MKQWQIKYKGHDIIVQNSISKERLFVDGELQHENLGFGFRSSLFGKIKKHDNEGLQVKVILGGAWAVHCRIFVNYKLVFHSKPDKKAIQLLQDI